MLGLFKTKLNPTDHLAIINYLIIEEAEQQWNYHAVENNFDKKAFRSASFAKGVVNMFVTKILKMKADDKILMAVVDLGHRRCQEYIVEYTEKKKFIKKIPDEKLLFNYFSIEFYFDHISKKHSDLKGMNELLMIEGKDSIDFNYRKQAYELIAETNREMQLVVKTMFDRFTKSKTDAVIDKYKKKWNKLKEEDRKSWIKNIRDIIMDTIEDRNPNNLLDQMDKDINFHPNNFFDNLENTKTILYNTVIERQIKSLNEKKLLQAMQFEISQFPKDSQMDTQHTMYLGGYETWLYDNEFWKETSVFDAFEFFMRMARSNTYYFKKFHKENPTSKTSQKRKNECFSLYQLTTVWFSWHAIRDRSIRKSMGIKKNIFG